MQTNLLRLQHTISQYAYRGEPGDLTHRSLQRCGCRGDISNKVMTYTFTVMDTEGSATKSGSGTVFHNGTTVASELRFKTCIARLPGHQLFGGTWSNKKFTNLNQDGRLILSNVILPNRGFP